MRRIAFRGTPFLGVSSHLKTTLFSTVRNCLKSLIGFCKSFDCMLCVKCRAAVEGDGTLVDRMDRAAEEICGCERVRVHELSPGIVLDEEELHFVVAHPGGILDGKLNPSFLIPLDRNGLSVLRGAAANAEFELTLEELRARWEGKARKFHGIATLKTQRVRYEAAQRLCCVYDTAMVGKPYHADIAGPEIKSESKTAAEKLRRQRLKRLIDNAVLRFEAAADFRSGVLSRFVD